MSAALLKLEMDVDEEFLRLIKMIWDEHRLKIHSFQPIYAHHAEEFKYFIRPLLLMGNLDHLYHYYNQTTHISEMLRSSYTNQ